MTTDQALQRLGDVIRRKHFALATGRSYRAWLQRYCDFIKALPAQWPSERKLEQFLTALARDDVAASTQNQAFNALLFFYREVMGSELKNVQTLRARRPAQVRRAPSREDTLRLIQAVQKDADFAISLAVRLIYGCGLRVTEPLNLRIKDVDLPAGQLVIRAAKGGKDRVVPARRWWHGRRLQRRCQWRFPRSAHSPHATSGSSGSIGAENNLTSFQCAATPKRVGHHSRVHDRVVPGYAKRPG